MDTNTLILIIVIIVAVILIVGLLRFRSGGKASIEALGVKGSFEGKNDPPPQAPGVTRQYATSRGGGILAEDKTGKGANVARVDVGDDIIASSSDETSPYALSVGTG